MLPLLTSAVAAWLLRRAWTPRRGASYAELTIMSGMACVPSRLGLERRHGVAPRYLASVLRHSASL